MMRAHLAEEPTSFFRRTCNPRSNAQRVPLHVQGMRSGASGKTPAQQDAGLS